MTTIDGTPTVTNFVLAWLNARARRTQAQKAEAMRASHRVPVGGFLVLIRLVLHIGAFCSLTYAAFLWDKIPGFIAIGFFLLVLSTLLTGRSRVPIDNHR